MSDAAILGIVIGGVVGATFIASFVTLGVMVLIEIRNVVKEGFNAAIQIAEDLKPK